MIKSIYPYWLAPKNVRALSSTRNGGVSQPPYESLNLGTQSGDPLYNVSENRRRLIEVEKIPTEPFWLNQTHSNIVVDISQMKTKQPTGVVDNRYVISADASYTNEPQHICVVLTADCLPVLFSSRNGDEVAAAHAGWRGLSNGILEETVKQFSCPRSDILAWMGPAIGPTRFEVGEEVKNIFTATNPDAAEAFKLINSDSTEDKFLANLYLLAKQRLMAMGLTRILGGDYCTFNERDNFYSYRRAQQTGRIASMIWFE